MADTTYDPDLEPDFGDPADWPIGAYRCPTEGCINNIGTLNLRQPTLDTPVICGGCGAWMHAPGSKRPNPAATTDEESFVLDEPPAATPDADPEQ